jgi:hypothetical protein
MVVCALTGMILVLFGQNLDAPFFGKLSHDAREHLHVVLCATRLISDPSFHRSSNFGNGKLTVLGDDVLLNCRGARVVSHDDIGSG